MGHSGRIGPEPPANQGASRQSAHQLPHPGPILALICPVWALSVVLMTHYVNTNDNHYTLCYHCQPHLSSHQFSLYAQFDKLPKVSEQCVMYNYPPSIPFPLALFLSPSPSPLRLSFSFFLFVLWLRVCWCCMILRCLLVLCLSFFYSLYILYYSFFILSYYSFLNRYIDILIIYIIYISIYKYIGVMD